MRIDGLESRSKIPAGRVHLLVERKRRIGFPKVHALVSGGLKSEGGDDEKVMHLLVHHKVIVLDF